jgi:hypothetical protein
MYLYDSCWVALAAFDRGASVSSAAADRSLLPELKNFLTGDDIAI